MCCACGGVCAAAVGPHWDECISFRACRGWMRLVSHSKRSYQITDNQYWNRCKLMCTLVSRGSVFASLSVFFRLPLKVVVMGAPTSSTTAAGPVESGSVACRKKPLPPWIPLPQAPPQGHGAHTTCNKNNVKPVLFRQVDPMFSQFREGSPIHIQQQIIKRQQIKKQDEQQLDITRLQHRAATRPPHTFAPFLLLYFLYFPTPSTATSRTAAQRAAP